MAQLPALGDTVRFPPAAFLGELSARLEDTPRQIVREVTGRVVSTVKTEGLKNIPLLVVQLIEKGRRTRMIVAADSTGQAGQGDLVYLIGSEHAAQVFRRELVPSDASIAGIIDTCHIAIPNDIN